MEDMLDVLFSRSFDIVFSVASVIMVIVWTCLFCRWLRNEPEKEQGRKVTIFSLWMFMSFVVFVIFLSSLAIVFLTEYYLDCLVSVCL